MTGDVSEAATAAHTSSNNVDVAAALHGVARVRGKGAESASEGKGSSSAPQAAGHDAGGMALMQGERPGWLGRRCTRWCKSGRRFGGEGALTVAIGQ